LDISSTYRLNDRNSFGLRVQKDLSGSELSIEAGATGKVNDNVAVKGKLDSSLNVSFSAKWKISDMLRITFGTQIHLKEQQTE